MKKILSIAGLLLLALLLFVLIKTLLFTSTLHHTKANKIDAVTNAALQHLSKAIQIKTISAGENAAIDTGAFFMLRSFIDSSYPLVHAKLERTVINNFSYIYHWKGSNASLPPFFLLAHSDVVPVEASSINLWHVEPFSGIIKDSAVWGRGSIDDKGSLIAILEAVENLLQQQFIPQRDIYLCFGHDEELGGEKGASQIVNYFQQKNIHAALVLDEGGIITKENFKELNRPIALLGVIEKGHVSFELSVEKEGGHSSMPEKETAIDILSRGLVKLRENQMPVHINEATNVMLSKIGPNLGFTTRMALANRWLFEGMLVSTFEKSKGTNASIHTTIVPTILEAGVKENVIPTVAKATINSRIMPGETSADVKAYIEKKLNDSMIKIKRLSFFAEPGKLTSYTGESYKKVETVAYTLMDDIVPVPFLMIGATDGRYYNAVSDAVIRFLPALDPHGFHGIDEQISFDDFARMIYMYTTIIKDK